MSCLDYLIPLLVEKGEDPVPLIVPEYFRMSNYLKGILNACFVVVQSEQRNLANW